MSTGFYQIEENLSLTYEKFSVPRLLSHPPAQVIIWEGIYISTKPGHIDHLSGHYSATTFKFQIFVAGLES
jgi:hypothetical protein